MVDERVKMLPEEGFEGIWSDPPPRERATPTSPASADAAARHHAWRRWFEGWIHEPLAKRSTGTNTLPPAYFISAARFIISTLRLDRSTDVVLDVGCDSAMVSRRVAPSCRQFVGVDFIPRLLVDTRRAGGSGAALAMAAADGRHLPFPDHTFDKVYCSAVVHTLPSLEDADRLLDELIRVCKPGGEVLLSSLPDVGKRGASRWLVWRRATVWKKVVLLGAFAMPPALRQRIKRAVGLPTVDPMRYLEFDLAAMAQHLTARGLVAAVVDFPGNYWSVDFRTSRSSLHVRLPRAARGDA
jgi:SAM-dependent methyltransferase